MNKQIIYLFLLLFSFLGPTVIAQEQKELDTSKSVSKLFRNQNILPLKLTYSNKNLKKNTNDSTYINSILSYKNKDGSWKTLDVKLRARGNFRRENCYFVPVKIKISKAAYKGTMFKGHKKLKLVLPCLLQKDNSDNVIKEYIAYKLYELISPYNFKTRLVDVSLSEAKGKKTRIHEIKGILIEDDKKIAKRFKGKFVERSINPLAQDNLCCVQNSFFQFMIGNIDFSIAQQHNAKLLYVDKEIFPIPFDFDMCGLVNASYATVSQTANNEIYITSVTERQYRGLKRDLKIIEEVRRDFLSKKGEMLDLIDSCERYFENPKEFENCRAFLMDFFQIIVNDKSYNREILSALRG